MILHHKVHVRKLFALTGCLTFEWTAPDDIIVMKVSVSTQLLSRACLGKVKSRFHAYSDSCMAGF